jgi:hypothetical protein
MAVIKGYADDSRQGDRYWAVGGYAGNDLQWERFEAAWPKIMKKHGVPYFHKREMGEPNGVYKKWQPFEDHAEEVKAFTVDIVEVISECWLRGFFSITRTDQLNRFNSETGLNLESYPLAAYGCMAGLASDLGGHGTIEVIFDRVEQLPSKLATAWSYAESDGYYPEIAECIVPIPLAKNQTFREVTPLQVADFLIWEVQKNHGKIEEWFLQPGKPHDPEQRSAHMDNWSLEKHGTIRPPSRLSLQALINHAAPLSNPIIWDYDNLSDANRLRGGKWA